MHLLRRQVYSILEVRCTARCFLFTKGVRMTKKVVLLGLSRDVNDAVKKVLSRGYPVQELARFKSRHAEIISGARIVVVGIDRISDDLFKKIRDVLSPAGKIVAVRSDNSTRQPKGCSHCIAASAAPDYLRQLFFSRQT